MKYLNKIEPKLVQKALRAIKTGKNFPDEILELGFLQEAALRQQDKIENFYEFVRGYTLEKLRYYRGLFGISVDNLRKRYHDGDSKLTITFDKEMLQLLALPQLAVDDDGFNPRAEHAPRIMKLFIRADVEALNANLYEWSALFYRYIEADILLSVSDLYRAADTEERTFQRWVDEAVNRLTDAIVKAELDFQRKVRKFQFEAELDLANYHELVGASGIIYKLNELIGKADGLKFVSIEGLGGIGKTSIAHAFAREIVNQKGANWAEIYWLSARNEWYNQSLEIQQRQQPIQTAEDIINQLLDKLGLAHLKALTFDDKISQILPLLAKNKFLIIIDNLETLRDSQILIEKLMSLTGASRFVLTSRETLARFGQVQSITVPELSPQFAQKLLVSELNRLNNQRQISSQEFQIIYDKIGGIPLALKLVASLLDCLPTKEIIHDLRLAPDGSQHEQMFRYIYRRTWSLLIEDARKLLLTLFDMDPNGTNLSVIRHFALHSGLLDEARFFAALKNLRSHSLLEITGQSEDIKYRLHRLTLSFLKTDILQR